jgi:hypothetical protein
MVPRIGSVGVVVAGAAVTIGCVHVERATGPDGYPDWWRISCPGRDDDGCYAKAHRVCPRHFRIAPIPESERRVDSQCHRTLYEVEFNVSKSCRGTLLIKCEP